MMHTQFKICLGLKGCEIYLNDDVEPSFLLQFKKFIGFKCVLLNKNGELLGESFRLWAKLWKQTYKLEVNNKIYIFEIALITKTQLLSEKNELLLQYDGLCFYTPERVAAVKLIPQKLKFLGMTPRVFEINTVIDPLVIYMMCGMEMIYDSMCP